jgi:hypothetical protein
MQSPQDVHLLFTLLARMDSHFAADDASVAKKLEGYARFGLKNPPRA